MLAHWGCDGSREQCVCSLGHVGLGDEDGGRKMEEEVDGPGQAFNSVLVAVVSHSDTQRASSSPLQQCFYSTQPS